MTDLCVTGLRSHKWWRMWQQRATYMPMSHTMPTVASEERIFCSASQEWSSVSPGYHEYMQSRILGHTDPRGSDRSIRSPCTPSQLYASLARHGYARNFKLRSDAHRRTTLLRDPNTGQDALEVTLIFCQQDAAGFTSYALRSPMPIG